MNGTNKLFINPHKIFLILGGIAALLVVFSVLGQILTSLYNDFISDHRHVSGLVRFFNLDEENNIPTIYSYSLLFFSFQILLLITYLEKKRKSPVLKWSALTICIFVMMFDEVFSFHEKLIIPVRNVLTSQTLGIFYFAWVIPGIAFLILFVIFFYGFISGLELKVRRTLIVAGILYFGGAIGFELIGGWYEEIHGENFAYNMIATVEESLEMAGVIVFIKGLLIYFCNRFKSIDFEASVQ